MSEVEKSEIQPSQAPSPPSPSDLHTQYDFGDGPSTSPPASAPEPAPEATPSPTEPAAQDRPRDPSTGRFLPTSETKHPISLTQKARELGFSDQEITDTPTLELRELVRDARMERLQQQQAAFFERALSQPPPSAAGNGQAHLQGESSPEAPGASTLAPGSLGLDESEYDPKLLAVLKQQHAQIQKLQQQLQQVHGHVESQQRETLASRFDKAFGGLGADYEPILGKGRVTDLADDAPGLLHRRTIITRAMQLAGKDATPEKVLAKVPEAAKQLFGALVKSAAPAPEQPRRLANPTEEEWLSGGLAKPTNRNGSGELPGRTKAERSVDQFLKERGIAGQTSIADEFPD